MNSSQNSLERVRVRPVRDRETTRDDERRGRERPYARGEDEMTGKIGNGLTEEEMAEVIESRDWPAYELTMEYCRAGKAHPNGRHSACPGTRQPTNHIDPHPTVCNCECHPWNEEVEWDDEPETIADLEVKLVREAAKVAEMINEDDDIAWDDEEEMDWEEV